MAKIRETDVNSARFGEAASPQIQIEPPKRSGSGLGVLLVVIAAALIAAALYSGAFAGLTPPPA